MQRLRKTVHTEVYIGSRKSNDKKMVASKARSGNPPLAISVTGETTARKVLVFNFTKMATSTKVCGPWTKSTVKAPTGEMKTPSSGENTLVIGLKTKSMEEAHSSSRIP